jgi:Flp pilus assembly pilin Flp
VIDGVFQADPWVETSAITRRQEHPFHESSVGFRRERTELGRRIALAFWLERRMIGINFPKFKPEEGKAMTTSPSPNRFPVPRHTSAEISAQKAEEFQSLAQLVEDLIPNFNKLEEKLFYREVVQSYREAARDILRKAWSDDGGQDIAEYAVMLAVILVLVVGTIRLVGSNANTVFSQAASSIQ